jgi:hypothetical protein
MQTRLIERVGTRYTLRKEWGECSENPSEFSEEHEARASFVDAEATGKTELPDRDHPVFDLAKNCEYCGEEAPEDAWRGAGSAPIYDTPSGNPEPGSLYYVTHTADEWCWFGWENCAGEHLVAVLPNGHHWQISQRASNCTRPEDKTHRCWVHHGDPRKGEPVHVDKNGDTCQAGAGSILSGDYHGFLHHGHLTKA